MLPQFTSDARISADDVQLPLFSMLGEVYCCVGTYIQLFLFPVLSDVFLRADVRWPVSLPTSPSCMTFWLTAMRYWQFGTARDSSVMGEAGVAVWARLPLLWSLLHQVLTFSPKHRLISQFWNEPHWALATLWRPSRTAPWECLAWQCGLGFQRWGPWCVKFVTFHPNTSWFPTALEPHMLITRYLLALWWTSWSEQGWAATCNGVPIITERFASSSFCSSCCQWARPWFSWWWWGRAPSCDSWPGSGCRSRPGSADSGTDLAPGLTGSWPQSDTAGSAALCPPIAASSVPVGHTTSNTEFSSGLLSSKRQSMWY